MTTVKFKELIMTENVVVEVTSREEVDQLCDFLVYKGQRWEESHREGILRSIHTKGNCYIDAKDDDNYDNIEFFREEGKEIISFAEALQEENAPMTGKMPKLESGMIVDIDDRILGECRGVLIEKDGKLILMDKDMTCMTSILVEDDIQRVYKLTDSDNLCLAIRDDYKRLSLIWNRIEEEKNNLTIEEQLANTIAEGLVSLGREKLEEVIELLTKLNDK